MLLNLLALAIIAANLVYLQSWRETNVDEFGFAALLVWAAILIAPLNVLALVALIGMRPDTAPPPPPDE